MSTRVSTPSSDFARSRPSLASWLNERSLRPPMSVTRPTLIVFLGAGVLSEPLLLLLLVVGSSSPQAATPNEKSNTINAAMIGRGRRTAGTPFLRGTTGAASLLPGSVVRGSNSIEQSALGRIVREGRP